MIKFIKYLVIGALGLGILSACSDKKSSGKNPGQIDPTTSIGVLEDPELVFENGATMSFAELSQLKGMSLSLLDRIRFPVSKNKTGAAVSVEQRISSICVTSIANRINQREKQEIVVKDIKSLDLIELISPVLFFDSEGRGGTLSCDIEIKTHVNGDYKKWNFIFNTPIKTIHEDKKIQVMKGTERYIALDNQESPLRLPVIDEVNFAKFGIVNPRGGKSDNLRLDCETFYTGLPIHFGGAVTFTNFNYFKVSSKIGAMTNPIQNKLLQICRIFAFNGTRLKNFSSYFRLKFLNQTSTLAKRHFPLQKVLVTANDNKYRIRIAGVEIENTSDHSLFYLIPFSSLGTLVNIYSLDETRKHLAQHQDRVQWEMAGASKQKLSETGAGRIIEVEPGGHFSLSYVLYGKHQCRYPVKGQFSVFRDREHNVGYLGFFFQLPENSVVFQINQFRAPQGQGEIIAKIPVLLPSHKEFTWVWHGKHVMSREDEERAENAGSSDLGRPRLTQDSVNKILTASHESVDLYSYCKREHISPFWANEVTAQNQ